MKGSAIRVELAKQIEGLPADAYSSLSSQRDPKLKSQVQPEAKQDKGYSEHD